MPQAWCGDQQAALSGAGDLVGAADVARRTIFREMLRRLSEQLNEALPPGVETRGDVADVLCFVARTILDLHGRPDYLGTLRMVVADYRRLPWIARALADVMEPHLQRLARYLALQTALGVLECRDPMLAARQLVGTLNELCLWPRLMGRAGPAVSQPDAADEVVRIFLRRHRCRMRRRRS